MSTKIIYYLSIIVLLLASCKAKPTIIQEDTPESVGMEASSTPASTPMDLHEVKSIDVQHTAKYTYVQVLEGTKSFCVAIPLDKEIKKGSTYYFRGGIIMANPEVLQFSEKFETVMISPGLSENPLAVNTPAASTTAPIAGDGIKIKEVKIETAPGVTTLAELFKNPEKFEGKTIKVQGQCVKLNRMILNKNWLHIQDNTTNKDGQKYDLTITTLDEVQLGDIVIFEGKLALNKDFGAGYKYDVILEESKLK
jgi:hypothetical protein